MLVNVNDLDIDDLRWRQLVAEHPDAGPFHLPEWAKMVADCYGFRAFALGVLDGSQLVGGLPVVEVQSILGRRRWISLPFTDSCAPLWNDPSRSAEAIDALRVHARASGVSELELRCAVPKGDGAHPVEVGYTYDLVLPSEACDLHPSKGHRQHRNKASRSGMTVARGASPSDVAAYYHLHSLTRRRQGVPVQPRRFFELVWSRMLARGHGFVASAFVDGRPVAAVLYLLHNRRLVAKFRASDPEVRENGAGFLVDWDVMASCCGSGMVLDLGRTDPGAEGQRRYKTGWGATETPLVYTHLADRAPAAPKLTGGGLASHVIRHSPLWVPRAVGEVLYRWTA